MISNSWIEIHRGALLHNYNVLNSHIQKGKLIPVLKSNSYGHGLEEVFTVLREVAPKFIAVNYLYEALHLRDLGFSGRILIVGPTSALELETAYKNSLEITLTDSEIADAWLISTHKPECHLKIDTGMSRLGFLPDEIEEWAAKLGPFKAKINGLSSHFANVEDIIEQDFACSQLELFNQVKDFLSSSEWDLELHIASSASGLLMPESHFDYIRSGISLFGLWPSPFTRMSYAKKFGEPCSLQPVLSWFTKIASIKRVPAGRFVGYGCTFKTTHDTVVGVIPVGYYEGLDRRLSNKGAYVLIDGHRCPILGRVCMNMAMVDLTYIPHAKVGQVVTIIGQDKSEVITAENFGDWADTIHYEIVTRLSQDIPRKVIH